jgi:uncharacterized Zn finger protein
MAEREYANCPECNYSASPDEIRGQERKHFHPHSLRCVRCGYQTETKATWPDAKRAWNKAAAAATQRRTAESWSRSQFSNDEIYR